MKKALKWVIAAVILLAVIAVSDMFYTVREDQHALVTRFSKVVHAESEAGVHMKIPFVDDVVYYSKAAQLYDINPSAVYLKDKTAMIVDSFLTWRITDPLLFHTKLSGSISEAQVRLDSIAYNNTRAKLGNYNQDDIVNTDDPAERNAIYENIASFIKQEATQYGIEVLDVKIKRFDLPESNENEVYNRMISERNQIAEQYRAQGETAAALIINAADRSYNTGISDAGLKAEQLAAEAEAEYMRILSEAYSTPEKTEFYSFLRAINALKASLASGEKTVILGKDSIIAKMLTGADING
ncbi:MAG: protease modulator HflC [Clostridia bacterium]|nr:protease modulator HflC [Clostridia bacterium]MBQ6183725.1 protease modulator HflC [Clostridia bacterium]